MSRAIKLQLCLTSSAKDTVIKSDSGTNASKTDEGIRDSDTIKWRQVLIGQKACERSNAIQSGYFLPIRIVRSVKFSICQEMGHRVSYRVTIGLLLMGNR